MEEKELTFEDDLLAGIVTEPQPVGTVLLVFGETGVGKTTMFVQAPDVLVVQVKDTSIDFLKKAKRISQNIATITAKDWENLLAILFQLATRKHQYKTIIVDGISGVELFCNDYVTANEFDGNKGKFVAYGAGDKVSGIEFGRFVNVIQQLRDEAKLTVVMIAHREMKVVENPEGDSYPEYRPQISHLKLAPLTKYIDATLMIDYHITVVDPDKKTGKGTATGGSTRIMVTDGKATVRAKNRLGLKPIIVLGNSHEEAWANFTRAMLEAKK